MNKQQVLQWISNIIWEHPDWMADMVMEMNRSLLDVISDNNKLRADAETALLMTYEKSRGRLLPNEKSKVEDVIIKSAMFAGTKYVADLKEARNGKSVQ